MYILIWLYTYACRSTSIYTLAFRAAATVTKEWTYTAAPAHADATSNVAGRFEPTFPEKRRNTLRMKSLRQVLNPQPKTAAVLHGLLAWIDRADRANQAGEAKPPIQRADGKELFPVASWWLTELEQRKSASQQNQDMDEANIDEEDLTLNPEQAGVASSSSDESLDEDGEASLPAGPVPKRQRLAHPLTPAVPHLQGTALSGAHRSTPGNQNGSKRRRLRGKQPMPASRVPMAAPIVAADHVPSTVVSSPAARPRLLLRGLGKVAQTAAPSALVTAPCAPVGAVAAAGATGAFTDSMGASSLRLADACGRVAGQPMSNEG